MENLHSIDINSGFLLSRQVKDTSTGILISLWLKTDTGVVKLEVENELTVFFIEQSLCDFVRKTLFEHKINFKKLQHLDLKTFTQRPVAAIYFNSMHSFYRARDALKHQGVKCYEDDVRPDDRFLMERHITADLTYIGNPNKTNSKNNLEKTNANTTYQVIKQAKCKKSSYVKEIALSMLSLDVECSMQGELYSIGLYANNSQDEFKRVLMIGEPQQNSDNYIHWLADEKALLQRFIEEVVRFDADIFIGWNVINFDLQLLQKRCDFHHIKLAIARDGSQPYWRKKINNNEQNFVEIAGRVVLDGIDLMKTATYTFSSFSLDNVASSVLGLRKNLNNADNRVKEITNNFKHNKPALAAYNLEDCRLVWLIFEKTQLLAFAKLRAQLTGLSIDRVGGSVAAFTNLYLPKLHRSGYIAPNMGDGYLDLVSPGGYVMDSVPGLYDNVLVLDFKSLYPSIIRTFKIDPMGLIEGLNVSNASISVSQLEQELTSTIIKGFDGAYFSRKHHFLPGIIKSLWLERDKAKLQNNAILSQAIKIIMNSFYGVLGSTGCRFFDPRLSGSITKRSHELLKTTGSWITDIGYQVIYGDTDSIFVAIGAGKSEQEVIKIGKELQDYINVSWQKKLHKKFNIHSELEIEFETHFSRFFMPSIRGNNLAKDSKNIGTKKRYAGLTKGNLVFKGLETVRSDWTALSKEFQQALYKRIFNKEPVTDYIKEIVEELKLGKFDDKLIYQKKIRRKLADYVNTPPHIKAAIIANNELQKRGMDKKYDHRRTIQYVMTIDGVRPLEFNKSKLDYDFYVDKQLKPIANDILPFIGSDFDSIAGNQMDLF